MTSQQFVQLAKAERDSFFESCFDPASGMLVAMKIAALQLDPARMKIMREVIGGLLTDVFYTWLLALDGCASFGGEQNDYFLADEDGNVISGGNIEVCAYEAFHGEGPA